MLYLSIVFGVILVEQSYAKLHNYDNFDMEALLSNGTRSINFFECVMDETKCLVKEDKEMKHDLIEVVSTSCADCTTKEKQKYGDVMTALRRSMGDSQIISRFMNKLSNLFHQGSRESDGERT